jgi:nucleoside-diphosphate kinase
MTGNKTFTMIKPNAVSKGNIGNITAMIEKAGFRIAAMKLLQMTPSVAEGFYAEHKGKPFFGSLVEFMTSGPTVVAILEKDNAVEDFRSFIGSTDPAKAAEGSVRKLYGESLQCNAVHGSDSDSSAERECNYFFSATERV